MKPKARSSYQPQDMAHSEITSRIIVKAALKDIILDLAPQAHAIFVREPLIDPLCPKTSDLDLLVFGRVNELLPQRWQLSSEKTAPMVDLIWLPTHWLEDIRGLAFNGLIPHWLLCSRCIYDKTGQAKTHLEALDREMYRPEIQRKRIGGFLEMGLLTVQEIGVTLDFPALALFWLHMAHAACIAALCDGMRIPCPNVYTRPFEYARLLEEQTDLFLEDPMINSLHLSVEPQDLFTPLRCIHQAVSKRFPEPEWPAAMRKTTLYEYRYFLSRAELDWRLRVAAEMIANQDLVAAVFYLRFWAYTLARIPMVHQRALEGIDVSFIRPSRAIRPELEAVCPEIISDLTFILGGYPGLEIDEVMCSLHHLIAFRDQAVSFLEPLGLEMSDLQEWRPLQTPSMIRPMQNSL